jgi:hypothetical protein
LAGFLGSRLVLHSLSNVRDAKPLEGFRSSIIDYAEKIYDLFAKMEGVRAEVLPPNREIIDHYFTRTWREVCTLIDAVPSPLSLSLNPEIFKPYIEAEEARLSANLKAVNYIIDGSDTLSLVTGVGRIEKVGTWKYTLNCSQLISVT